MYDLRIYYMIFRKHRDYFPGSGRFMQESLIPAAHVHAGTIMNGSGQQAGINRNKDYGSI